MRSASAVESVVSTGAALVSNTDSEKSSFKSANDAVGSEIEAGASKVSNSSNATADSATSSASSSSTTANVSNSGTSPVGSGIEERSSTGSSCKPPSRF